MEWQWYLTYAVILVAGGYIGLRGWRAWRGSKGSCSGGCGCTSAEPKAPSTFVPSEDLVIRKRSTSI
jgi:hypothetical protein